MPTSNLMISTKQTGTGLCFVFFPIVFVFAFSLHPDLLHPQLFSALKLILGARGDGLLQFAHAVITINTALYVVVALHLMKVLDRSSGAWAGFPGAAVAVLGTLALAADKRRCA